ncbi:LysR family transcriptional regulator [Pigmentiphaga sp. H8]|uniref:LysR family transcriptional regulator n=1 Tax=unclassified Pigmentiphaga TaxID=2626614 RepID=UPI000F59571C|nr:LysR family transcriptional regulator [Pigmentiphaga sp. H8]AZG06612.1 LysR family transcriptional regulator [Pigmentiphaga sp. H8]
MRLEDLNYFLAVAETGHVGRASTRLGHSQPALTKGLQRLEKELGIQLFERTPKGMALTTAGAAFFERARHVRTGLDDAIKEASDLHLGKIGLVRVGVAPAYVQMLCAPACSALITQRPAARIHMTTGLNDALFGALRQGELDLCISAIAASPEPEFDQHPLMEDDLLVMARDQHPLFDKRSLRFADLVEYGWILPTDKVMARRAIDARFLEAGLPTPEVVIESSSTVATLLPVVRTTDLLTVVGQRAAGPSGGGLRSIPLEQARWRRTIGICTRRGAYQSPLAKRFIEIVDQHARDLTGA